MSFLLTVADKEMKRLLMLYTDRVLRRTLEPDARGGKEWEVA